MEPSPSASDRPAERHPVDVAQDEVQRAAYDHASESWYHRSVTNGGELQKRSVIDIDDEELDELD